MKWIGPVLLVGVFARHNLAWSLPGYNPQAWFYMLGGLWEILLCSILLLTLPALPLVRVAISIGILEGAQVTLCRLATTGPLPKGNLCDALLGFPLGPWLTGFYIILIAVVTARQWKRL